MPPSEPLRQDRGDLMTTRRLFLRWLAGLPLLPLIPFTITDLLGQATLRSGNPPGLSIGETYAGEALHYEIAFWLFKKVAKGNLAVRRGDQRGTYVAALYGETLGVLGMLARYRVDFYRAVMEEVDGGRRFRSLSFDEYVKVGKNVRRNMHVFDHENRKWIERTVRASGAVSRTEHEIPEGKVYDDFLTAAFNFRHGVYGPVERGRTYTVPTFPRKDVTSYQVKVASRKDEARERQAGEPMEGSEYYIELSLDPEVTTSKEGAVEGWLAKELYPVEGTIKDVILFGDVHGTLVKRIPPTAARTGADR